MGFLSWKSHMQRTQISVVYLFISGLFWNRYNSSKGIASVTQLSNIQGSLLLSLFASYPWNPLAIASQLWWCLWEVQSKLGLLGAGLGSVRKTAQSLNIRKGPEWSGFWPPLQTHVSLLSLELLAHHIYNLHSLLYIYQKALLFSTKGPSLVLIPFYPAKFTSLFRSELKPVFLLSSTDFSFRACSVPDIVLGPWDRGWFTQMTSLLSGGFYSRRQCAILGDHKEVSLDIPFHPFMLHFRTTLWFFLVALHPVQQVIF